MVSTGCRFEGCWWGHSARSYMFSLCLRGFSAHQHQIISMIDSHYQLTTQAVCLGVWPILGYKTQVISISVALIWHFLKMSHKIVDVKHTHTLIFNRWIERHLQLHPDVALCLLHQHQAFTIITWWYGRWCAFSTWFKVYSDIYTIRRTRIQLEDVILPRW